MKTLKPFLYLLVVFAIVLSACNKDVHKIGDDENLDIQVRNMEDLIVPADFDWKMYMNSSNTLKTSPSDYPASGYSTLAFEDLWPSKGDYDFNDLVVEYRFIAYADDSIVGNFIFRAVGAGTRNGFGFELTGVNTTGLVVTGRNVMSPPSSVYPSTNGWENGHGNNSVVIVAEDVTKVLPLWSNTSNYGGITRPAEIVKITIKRSNPGGADPLPTITESNFNPFMIIDFVNSGRGREVHLRDKPATAKADLSLFGTEDDYSSTTFGNSTYKTIKNFPWVLDIPSTETNPTASNSVFFYPTEKSDINWAYLKFAEWAESEGDDFGSGPDAWWINTDPAWRNTQNIYNR